ncbi:MAG: protein translocase subunit SecF [Alphaproteobacteria bacterium]|nr:protein translocase subunit SecF [Alphaproteobacteria bacterium]NDC55674.1 protein translocase subunit SecF [Alphaproteobacteria bacterium]
MTQTQPSVSTSSGVPNIDFVKQRYWAFVITALLLIASMASVAVQGLNLGIDFKGGILLEVRSPSTVDISAWREKLGGLGLGEIQLQEFGDMSDQASDISLRIQRQEGDDATQMQAVEKVRAALADQSLIEWRRTEVVGPTVGRELFMAGITATVLALLGIAAYVAVRFEWQFGVAALLATLHDVLVTVGLFSVLQLDFNLTAVAAVLTLAGYSINDTVVVFDRLRENLRKTKQPHLPTLINLTVNQTLSRTLMTSGTTLIVMIPLAIFGGDTLLNFSVAIIWGILIGTYSSIYVAASLLLYMPPLRRVAGEDIQKDN